MAPSKGQVSETNKELQSAYGQLISNKWVVIFIPALQIIVFIQTIIYIIGSMVSVDALQLSPNCKDVLDEKTFALVPSKPGKEAVLIYYHVFQKSRILHDTCSITRDQGLRIGLEKITRISDVLIGQAIIEKRLPNYIEVWLIRGASLFKCEYSDDLDVSNVTNAKYSCPMNGFANALEIRSVALWTIDLTDVKTLGSLGWLILRQNAQGCQPPGLYPGQSLSPVKEFYLPEDEVKISCKKDFEIVSPDTRKCNRTGFWFDEPPICQPKETWFKSDFFLDKPTIAAGMENVSFVVAFNRSLNNIRKIGFGFEIALNKSETIRTLHENFVLTIWSLNSNIYQHRLETIHFGDDAVLENFAHTLDDIAAKQECLNCKIEITFPNYHWDVCIIQFVAIKASSTFESGEEFLRLSKACPPLDPYPGMPLEYSNYESVLNGSISELLREAPCRQGFKFQGSKDDISSCSNGKWKGKGFPVCEVVRTKSPPEVSRAKWNYVHDDAFHEIIYTCEHGLNITAKYDLKADRWTDNIDCQKTNVVLLILCLGLVVLMLVLTGIAAFFVVRCKRNKRNVTEANQSESNEVIYSQIMH